MPDDNDSDNADYNFIDQVEKEDEENGASLSPSKLQDHGLMGMPKTNQLMSQKNKIAYQN